MWTFMRLAWAVAIIMIVSMPSTFAADANGGYALRGAGNQPCPDYLAMLSDRKPNAGATVAWIDGYISAHNRYQQGTFDAVPILADAAVLTFVANVCKAKKDLRVEGALVEVLRVLSPHRLQAHSPVVTAKAGNQATALRQETLVRAQTKLREKGLYKGSPDGLFGAGTRTAFQAFQRQAGLTQTGLPDANTLIRLLFDK